MEILLLLAIGILLPLVGQPQAIDVTEFSPNSTLFINKYIEFSKSSVSVDFDSILLASRQSTFRKLGDREMILLGYDPDFYWYRFSISNQKPLEQRVMLLLTQLAVREMEIFQGVNGQWASLGKTGYQYPFESRPYQYAHFVYPITVPPHSTSEFYVQVDDSHSYKVIAFALLHPVMLNGFQQGFYFFFGFMIGIMLLFFLFNIYLFATTNDRIHAWYSFYLLLQSILLIKQHGLETQFLNMDFELAFRATNMFGFGALGLAVLIHVVQLFLQNLSGNKVITNTTTIVKYIVGVLAILQLSMFLLEPSEWVERIVYEVTNKVSILGLMFVLSLCIISYARGFKPALLLIIGLLFYFIGGIERLLFLFPKSYYFPPSMLEIGIVAEAVIISFGLMLRYNQYRKERETLAQELALEKIIQEQNIQLKIAADRDRIKKDLHDSLGGQLSSISFGLNRLLKGEKNEMLVTIQNLADKAMNELRDSLWVLDKQEVTMEELEQRINSVLWQYRKVDTPIKMNLEARISTALRLPAIAAGNLFRIVQEAIQNAVMHSEAGNIDVLIDLQGNVLTVTVADNGKGFSWPAPSAENHFGMSNMEKRANEMNAKLLVSTNEGQGTTLSVKLKVD